MSIEDIEQEHAHLVALIESADSAVISFTKDLDGTIQTWNSGAERLYGYSAEEAIGENISILLPPDYPNDMEDILARIKNGESIIGYETKRMRKDGTVIEVLLNVSPIKRRGRIIGASVIALDVTDRKRVLEALIESEQRFASFMLHLPAAAWIKDLEGRYVYANAEAERIFSTPLSELRGKTDSEIFLPETAEQFVKNDRRVLSEGSSLETTEVLHQANGIDHYSIVSKFAVPGPDGLPIHIAGVAFDITELKKAEEQLKRKNEFNDALNRINAIIFSTLDYDEIMRQVLAETVKAVGAESAAIYLPEDSFWVARYVHNLPNLMGKRLTDEEIKYSTIAANEGRVVRVNNLSGNAEMCRVPITESGVKALLDAPLHVGEMVIGDFALYSCSEGEVFSDLHEDFLKKVSASVTLAVKNAQLFKTLTEREQDLRRFYEAGLLGVIHWNMGGAVSDANDKFLEMVGYTREELKNGKLDWVNMTPPEYRHLDELSVEELKATGINKVPFEKEYVRKDGTRIPILLAGAMLDEARFNGVAFVLDISKRKKAEAEIRRLNEALTEKISELEYAMKELEAFNTMIAHDLRSPLTRMSSFADFIIEDYADKLDNLGKDYLSRIKVNSEKMTQLVDALLNLSRMSRQAGVRSNIDLSMLASSIVAELRYTSPERTVEVSIGKDLTAYADLRLMEIVLSNLLGNAWKYTSKIRNARVEFGSLVRQGETVFYIRDNGVGFDPQYADKIFLPFQRLHTDEEFKGSGIGLATVERIIRRHGGKVWAEGEPGKGASFYFTVPATAGGAETVNIMLNVGV